MADYTVKGTQNAYSSDANKNLNSYRASGIPNINTDGKKLAVTSTNVSVYSNGARVGFIQSFAPTEQRTITPIHELGSEGVIQMAAGNTTGGTIAITRFAVYNSSLFNALGLTRTGNFVPTNSSDFVYASTGSKDSTYQTYTNPFKCLKDQRVPLEIKCETQMPNDDGIMTETYIDCWLQSYSRTVTSQTITISQQATVSYADLI